MRTVSKILATIFFAIVASLAISPLAAAVSSASNVVFIGMIGIVALVCMMAKTGRRAWGWGALICGALFLALPLTMTALSGVVFNEVVSAAPLDTSGATAAGAAIGSGLMVGASAFFGFFVGGIFIVLGLVLTLGGRNEVVVVEKL